MKKMLALLLTLLYLMVPALAEMPDLTQYADEELRQMRDQINIELSTRQRAQHEGDEVLFAGSLGDYNIEILAVDIVPNYVDAPCVLYTFRFTNNSTDTLSMIRAIELKPYQAGITCGSPTMIAGTKLNEISMVELRPGASYILQYGYLLNDETSPVELEIRVRNDYTGKYGMLRFDWLPTD